MAVVVAVGRRIMSHGENGIWSLADVDESKIRPQAPTGATGSVEYEAVDYLVRGGGALCAGREAEKAGMRLTDGLSHLPTILSFRRPISVSSTRSHVGWPSEMQLMKTTGYLLASEDDALRGLLARAAEHGDFTRI